MVLDWNRFASPSVYNEADRARLYTSHLAFTLSGHELTLEYKGGSQTVQVPDGPPINTTVPADRALLTPGTFIFTVAQAGPATQRIQAAKDDDKPRQ